MPATNLDIEGTRARLAAVERQLAADPDNDALRWQRFRLANVLECLEEHARLRRCFAWGRLLLGTCASRN